MQVLASVCVCVSRRIEGDHTASQLNYISQRGLNANPLVESEHIYGLLASISTLIYLTRVYKASTQRLNLNTILNPNGYARVLPRL